MSTSDTSGFGKFVPGFDFLQNLAKNASGGLSGGAAASGVPNLSQWLAPSLNVEDLEKRIEELKHVQFWLEQNSRALAATIQALEVQKLTMATLKGMNFTMGMPGAAPASPPASSGWPMPAAAVPQVEPAKAPPPAPEKAAEPAATAADEKPAAGVIDPLQLWGALTQQFQTIAANAFKEVSDKVAAAPSAAKTGGKKTAPVAKKVAKKSAAKKAPAKKAAAKSAAAPTRRRSV
ncbi:MAG: PhaM family polyhydroxyalkanoate granule multifunctional regulatory protein [Betaproteobacteria bacterium]